MDMLVTIHVSVSNPTTGEVTKQFIQTYQGQWGFAIEQLFDYMGKTVANVVDTTRES